MAGWRGAEFLFKLPHKSSVLGADPERERVGLVEDKDRSRYIFVALMMTGRENRWHFREISLKVFKQCFELISRL